MPHPYDSTYALAFPILPVVVRELEGSVATSSLSALVDTGADITLVPVALLEEIGAEEIYVAHLRSHWGEARSVSVFLIDLEVMGHLLPAVEVVGDDHDNTILLGRNVLNKLILLCDGPRQQSDVLAQYPR